MRAGHQWLVLRKMQTGQPAVTAPKIVLHPQCESFKDKRRLSNDSDLKRHMTRLTKLCRDLYQKCCYVSQCDLRWLIKVPDRPHFGYEAFDEIRAKVIYHLCSPTVSPFYG